MNLIHDMHVALYIHRINRMFNVVSPLNRSAIPGNKSNDTLQ